MTDYMILQRTLYEDVEQWRYRGHEEARSGPSAIRAYLNGSEEDGEFVAVPARSWKPVTVKVETKTALRFS